MPKSQSASNIEVVPQILKVRDVSKRFVIHQDNSVKERVVGLGRKQSRKADFWALSNVSFEAIAGETLGLIGHNGSGKSTLLKLIGGIIRADSGTIQRRGSLAALLELGTGFHPDLTGRENVFLNGALLGLSKEEVAERFDEIVAFSEIDDFIDTQVKYYSSGMYVRLAFAVAVHTDPDLLLVDEVLAVGDEAFQQKCLAKIREFQREGRTIVIVTHSLDVVEDMCDRAVVLDHGTAVFIGESREAVKHFRGLLREHELGEREKQAARLDGRIDSVEIESADDLAKVSIAVSTRSGLENWAIGLRVRAQDSYPVLSVDNEQARTSFDSIPPEGNQHFDFVLDTKSFGNGEYAIEAVLFSKDGYEIDVSTRAAIFEINKPQSGVGVVASEVHVHLR